MADRGAVCGTVVQNVLRRFRAVNIAWLYGMLVALGIVLRVRELVEFRVFWIDEVLLATNIIARAFDAITLPLAYDQAFPVALLLFQKIMVMLFGAQDYVLRVLPFAAGVLALVVMARVVRVYTEKWTGLLALALTALSYRLVYYTGEMKQYSTDVLFFLCVCLMVDRYTRRPVSGRAFVRLYLVGALLLLCSHPAAFALAGLSAVMLIAYVRVRDWRRARWVLAIGMAWAIEIAFIYVCWARHVVASTFMQTFWAEKFMPAAIGSIPQWFVRCWSEIMRDWVSLPVVVGSVLVVVGLGVLWQRQRYLALFLIVVFVSMVSVSRFMLYPFSGRLSLFLLPMVYLLAAEGVRAIAVMGARAHRGSGVGVAAVLTVLVVWLPAGAAFHNFRQPYVPNRNDPRGVVSYLAQHEGGSVPVYVHPSLYFYFRFYAHARGFAPEICVYGSYAEKTERVMEKSVGRMLRFPRAWFIAPRTLWENDREAGIFPNDSVNEVAMRELVLLGRSIDVLMLEQLGVDAAADAGARASQVATRDAHDFRAALLGVVAEPDLFQRVERDGLIDRLSENDRVLLDRARSCVSRGTVCDRLTVRDLNYALLQAAYYQAFYAYQWEERSWRAYLDGQGTCEGAYSEPNACAAYLYAFPQEDIRANG